MKEIRRLNYGIAIIERNKMLKLRRLIGDNPGFYELDEIESIDIDTEGDFFIAEHVVTGIKNSNK